MCAAFTDVGVAHDHRGEGVVLKLADHVHAVGATQIVEAVTVLQVLHLVLEHEAEARPQHAAEGHDGFRQTADPELDIVDASLGCGPGTGTVDIVQTVRRRAFATQHKGRRRRALGRHGHGGDDGLMRTSFRRGAGIRCRLRQRTVRALHSARARRCHGCARCSARQGQAADRQGCHAARW